MTNKIITTPLERLSRIDWQFDDTRNNSQTLLFLEYLRRMALWAQLLDCGNNWPFFDVATHICPELIVSETDISLLVNHLNQFSLKTYVKQTCIWYLHWTICQNSSISNMPKLPEPYEPLIMMYERGERFYTEHGFIYLSQTNLSVSRQHWQGYISQTPKVRLESDFLNEIDSLTPEELRDKLNDKEPIIVKV